MHLWLFPLLSINNDEAVYLHQARNLLEGHFTQAYEQSMRAFTVWFQGVSQGRLFYKYTPVHSAMLAVSLGLFGSPVATLAIATGMAVLGFAKLITRSGLSERGMRLAIALFALNPFLLLIGATCLPYVPSFAILLWALHFGLRAIEDPHDRAGALACGLLVSLAFFSRPLDGLVLGAALGLHGLLRLRAGVLRIVPAFLLGAAPFLVATLAYNFHIKGNPLSFPFRLDVRDAFLFGERKVMPDASVVHFTPRLALIAAGSATQWLALWLGLPTALLALFCLFRRLSPWSTPATRVLFLFCAALWGMHLIFWGNSSQMIWGSFIVLGPFYFLPFLAPVSICAAASLDALLSRPGFSGLLRTTVLTAAFLGAVPLLVHAVKFHARYRDWARSIRDTVLSFEPAQRVIVFPLSDPGNGRHLLHPYSFLENDLRLRNRVIFASDLDSWNFRTFEREPDRMAMRLFLDGEFPRPREKNWPSPKLLPFELLSKKQWQIRFRVDPPPGTRWVHVYVGAPGKYARLRTQVRPGSAEVPGGGEYQVRFDADGFVLSPLPGTDSVVEAPLASKWVPLRMETSLRVLVFFQPGIPGVGGFRSLLYPVRVRDGEHVDTFLPGRQDGWTPAEKHFLYEPPQGRWLKELDAS
jgi:4-amino-4-deoxy-L-arabinose transferase-like glycosyltransferase